MDNKLIELSKPIVFGLFEFGNGRFYNALDNKEWAERYRLQIHQSSDSVTLDIKPLYSQEYVSTLLADNEALKIRVGQQQSVAANNLDMFRKADARAESLLAELEKKDREIAVIAMVTNDQVNDVADHWRDTLTELQTELEEKDRRIAELEAKLATPVRLPRPACTYADHSYPSYSRRQVEEIITTAGMFFTVEGDGE